MAPTSGGAAPVLYPIGTVVQRNFQDPATGQSRPYRGVVVANDRYFDDQPGVAPDALHYHVRYDSDGDEEDIPASTFAKFVVVETLSENKKPRTSNKQRKKRKPPPAVAAAKRAAAKRRVALEQKACRDNGSSDDELMPDAPQQRSRRRATQRKRTGKKKKVKDADDEEEEASSANELASSSSEDGDDSSVSAPPTKRRSKTRTAKPATKRTARRAKVASSDDEEVVVAHNAQRKTGRDVLSSDEESAPKPKRGRASRNKTPKQLVYKDYSTEEDADSSISEASLVDTSDEDDDISLVVDEDEDEDEEDEPKMEAKRATARKPRATKAKPITAARRKTPAGQSSDEDTKPKGTTAAKKKPMSESFKPKNEPSFPKLSLQEIYDQHEFYDPCGMDGDKTDLIHRCVSDQIDAIGGLLVRAQPQLVLGTACSGTDAPALAMHMVQEQLRRRQLDGTLQVDHVFSCEKEAFKQAYLERNFDSILYPDITQLVPDPTAEQDDSSNIPQDVYGRAIPLPDINMFVAGTSCKNFSMMRSKWRIDIEDKGCSGETFMAAVEVLFRKQPKFAIFENVIGAPWGKMSEYITGRVHLKTAGSQQYIKGSSKNDLTKEPVFAREADGSIIVEESAAVYGMRCGGVLTGFATVGSNAVDTEIQWPKGTKKKSTCTLSELKKANELTGDNILVFATPCTYCTKTIKVDTKEFALPQTRQRTYMLVWQPRNGDITDDLGDYFTDIANHLKSPSRYPLQAFTLDDDHEVIRNFREALRGPGGRQSKRNAFQEPDFWTSANANLPHNRNTRRALGLKDKARWMTNWGPHGYKQTPLNFQLEYWNCNNQRIMDMVDILNASGFRDAEVHDPLHSCYFWNVSQNASREAHRAAFPGVASCITPGGDFVVPSLGRPLLGCEKLLLQGIPYFGLLLGNETEVQLGDLAGNAMSLTVVGAIMLAALTAEQLRLETEQEAKTASTREMTRKKILAMAGHLPNNQDPVLTQEKGQESVEGESQSAMDMFRKLAELADLAVKTSVWCTCETSGNNSHTNQFVQCMVCKCSCCRNCINSVCGYNVKSHKTEDVVLSESDHNHGSFRPRLRQVLSPSISIAEEGWKELAAIDDDCHRVGPLASTCFTLQGIHRDRRKWNVTYVARSNEGIGEAMAELRLTIGEIFREQGSCPTLGVKVELKSFLPAVTEPRVPGPLYPCAKLTLKSDGSLPQTPSWYGKHRMEQLSMTIEGFGDTESIRAEVGLEDCVGDDLLASVKGNKKFAEAKRRGEEHRWIYPKHWRKWPETIRVSLSASSSLNLAGDYMRATCRQSTNQSALWIRSGSETMDTLYIIIRPNVNRTGPDTTVISRSSDDKDTSAVLVELPSTWDPCHVFDSERGHVVAKKVNWKPLTNMTCVLPPSRLSVSGLRCDNDVLFSVAGLRRSQVALFERHLETSAPLARLCMQSGQKAQQISRVFNSCCVTPIMKFVSSNTQFLQKISPDTQWLALSNPENGLPFGHCEKTLPVPPREKWIFREDRSTEKKKVWERISDPGASRNYYLQLNQAPQPFEFLLDRELSSLTVKYFPHVVAHHAAGNLIRNRGGCIRQEKLDVAYKLSDTFQQRDPVVEPFVVHSSMAEEVTDVALKKPHRLYDRQKRVVSKMLAIEQGQRKFEEVEMSEFEMPGSTGISLMARAKRHRGLGGGVIADSIGAGKTVISIALILHGLSTSRKSRFLPRSSSATLVLVPPALVSQWKSEIAKFADDVNVVDFYCSADFQKRSLKDILAADIVICPIDILESKGYLRDLLRRATGEQNCAVPTLPTHVGQVEQNAARGVWIPDTSTDPYGGANSDFKQLRRDESAYYTAVYSEAIQKLRQQEFAETECGVPLEYFSFERIIVDEVHESLCTSKGEIKEARQATQDASTGFFTEKNRRAGRELLGISQKDVSLRPLVCRGAVFGLTGTPLLDSSNRVIELANVAGGNYVTGLETHWRKMERESRRDEFLHHKLEPIQSREIRKQIYSSCQGFLDVASCRNKVGDEMKGIELKEEVRKVTMTEAEKQAYLQSQSGIASDKKSLSIKPEDFDSSAGHDISRFLRQNSRLGCRGKELVNICRSIFKADPTTKIIVFTDGTIGAGLAARDCLVAEGIGCTWLDHEADSVQRKNEKISWYQNGDATEEDRRRPRVLVLNFAHAAGLNLQSECYNVVFFTPLYIGEGGHSSDAVADTSTELQAIGRVYRPGQTRPVVKLYRIEVVGPTGEECLDGQIIRRNTDQDTVSQATNAAS